MIVQHNLAAMNASRMLSITSGQQAKASEKLSSGYRINRAADDAAGLSISEKMRKQIKGLTQASSNAQDGISSVQTAEGALTEVHSMLQRMNELAVQASNGTMSDDDRNNIQDEIDQLTTEIDRVSETTKFNETYMLKGEGVGDNKAVKVSIKNANGLSVISAQTKVDDKLTDTNTLELKNVKFGKDAAEDASITISSTTYKLADYKNANELADAISSNKDVASATLVKGNNAAGFDLSSKIGFSAGSTSNLVMTAPKKDLATGITSFQLTVSAGKTIGPIDTGDKIALTSSSDHTLVDISLKAASTSIEAVHSDVLDKLQKEFGKDNVTFDEKTSTFSIKGYTYADGTTTAPSISGTTFKLATATTDAGYYDNLNGKFDVTVAGTTVKGDTLKFGDITIISTGVQADDIQALKDAFGEDNVTGGAGGKYTIQTAALDSDKINITSAKEATTLNFSLHVGSESDAHNKIDVDVSSMNSESLGIKGIKVTTNKIATASIDTIADAIKAVSKQRSSLGAIQNRLEHTIANLDNVVENTTAAEARIRDVDMASEMVEYSKNNILAQAGQSMLAQANQSTQGILSLLR